MATPKKEDISPEERLARFMRGNRGNSPGAGAGVRQGERRVNPLPSRPSGRKRGETLESVVSAENWSPRRLSRDEAYQRIRDAGWEPDELGVPTSRKDYEEWTQSKQVRQFEDEFVNRVNNDIRRAPRIEEQRLQLAEGAANRAWQDQVSTFQDDLTALGQGDQKVAANWQNMADVITQLLEVDGDDEASRQARQVAATTYYQHADKLNPHLKQLSPTWLEDRSGVINQELQRMNRPGAAGLLARGLDAIVNRGDYTFDKGNIGRDSVQGLAAIASTDLGGDIFDTLGQPGEGGVHALGGIRAALDRNDQVSAGEGLRYAGSSLGRGVLGGLQGIANTFIADEAEMRPLGVEDGRALQADGQLLSLDLNASGDVNLREALGRDPEDGGRLAGLFDTVGLALVDPTTYVTMGQSSRVNATLRALNQSDNSAVRMAATQLSKGGRSLSSLDNVQQAAVRAEVFNIHARAAANMTPVQLARAGISNPTLYVKSALKKSDEAASFAEQLVAKRTDDMMNAIKRGSVPGVRVGGTTIIPARRLYDALGIIDSRLAADTAWSRKLLNTVDLEEPEALLSFIREFDPAVPIPPEIASQMRGWSQVVTSMTEPPDTWLPALLRGSEDMEQTFREVESFGRAIMDDRIVNDWVEWFDNGGASSTVRTAVEPQQLAPETLARTNDSLQLSAAQAKAEAAGVLDPNVKLAINANLEDWTPTGTRAIADRAVELSQESALAVRRNLDIIDDPYTWVMKDFKPQGVKGLIDKSELVSSLLRRMTDAWSTRAAVRRDSNLGSAVATQMEDAVVQSAAARDLLEDHMARLQLDTRGRSKLVQAAMAETTHTSPDAFWRSIGAEMADEANLAAKLAGDDFGTNTAELIRRMQQLREDVTELSVASGADRARLLAQEGYLPRVRNDQTDLVRRAEKLNNPKVNKALRTLGVIDTSGRAINTKNPLTQGGHLKRRSFARDVQDLGEVNDMARELLSKAGMDGLDGWELYQSNPMQAMLLRSRQAHEAFIETDFIQRMTDVMDTQGRPVAYFAATKEDVPKVALRRTADADALGSTKYSVVKFPNGGRAWVNTTIYDEMLRTRKIVGKPETSGQISAFMEKWNNLWGAWATLPVVGTGFFMRNAIGNVFNMVLAGVTNPAVFVDSAVQLRNLRRVRNVMQDAGSSFDEALASLNFDSGTANLLRHARKFDMIGSGASIDIFENFDPLTGRLVVNPLDQNSVLLLPGRKLNSAIENNARMALFMDGIQKGMEPSAAAARVRQHLFDYADITQFQADKVRMLSRFSCVPDSHRAMTREGWKYVDELVPGVTELMVLDPHTHETRWEVLEDVVVHDDHDQEINVSTWYGRSIWYTDDHRWPVERTYDKMRGLQHFNRIKTGWTVPTRGSSHAFPAQDLVGERLARIAGWIMADGTHPKRVHSKNQWFVYQKKQPYLAQLEGLLGTGDRRSVHPQTGVHRLPVKLEDRKALESAGFHTSLVEFVSRLSEREALACWEAMVAGDGWVNGGGHYSFGQSKLDVLAAYQVLAFSLGHSVCAVKTAAHEGRIPGGETRKLDYYTINHGNSSRASLFSGHSRVHYKGRVWCPRTPTGTWIVEHEGQVLPTGNTFMSKNGALQFNMLLSQPGRIVNAERMVDEFIASLFGERGEDVEPGQELGGGRVVPEWATRTMRLFGGDKLVSVDDPFSSAVNTLEAASMLLKVPAQFGVWMSADSGPAEEAAQQSLRNQFRTALQVFSGGPVEGFKTLTELGSGQDAFTGMPLEEVDRNWVDKLVRLTDSVIPVGGKIDRELEYYGVYEQLGVMQDEDNPDRVKGRDRLLNSILGLTYYTVGTDEQAKARMAALAWELNGALYAAKDALEEDGIDVPTMFDLEEMGRVSIRNEALQYLLYNTAAGKPLTPEDQDKLRSYLPQTVIDAWGLEGEGSSQEWTTEERAARIREMATAYEAATGTAISEDQIQELILYQSGARTSDIEALGIETSFRENPYTGQPEDEAARRAQSEQQLTDLSALLGVSLDELRSSRPLLQPAERKTAQMREAGFTNEEIVAELVTSLSRQERALLFGSDSLETTREDKPLTADEIVEYTRKAQAARAELGVIVQLSASRAPTQAEVQEWMSEVLLTAPEQRALGYEDYRPKPAENVTTDATYAERLRQKLEALTGNTDFEG